MSNEQKPREFWLVKNETIYCDVKPGHEDDPDDHLIHAIEYSAYMKLLVENERLVTKLSDCERRLGIAREALEEFRLGHEHQPKLSHIREMGDTYGWCDFCQTKVHWGPGIAEEALAQIDAKEGES